MPGLLRCTCGDYARVLHLNSHARLRVHWAPGIPCALCFLEAKDFMDNSGAPRRENAESCREYKRATFPAVIARLDRATQYSRGADDKSKSRGGRGRPRT